MARGFNGSTDKIAVTQINLGDTHSVHLLLNWQDGADGVVLGDTNSGGAWYMPYIDGTNIYYRCGLSGTLGFVAHGGLSSGTVYSIVITRATGTVAFFKDGSQIGTNQTITSDTQYFSTFGMFSTGAVPATCEISEVALWNRVLDAGEIAALGKRYTPAHFRRGGLNYWPLIGRNSPEIDLWRGANGTLTGTSAVAHPRVILPRRRIAGTFTGTSPPPPPPSNTNYLMPMLGVGDD